MFLASQHVLFTLLMGYLNSFIPSLTDLEKNRIQRPRLDNVLYLCVRVELSRIQLFATPWSVAGQAPLSMEFSRQDTGVGGHFLLQGIFLTQGSNLGLLHCRQILYKLSHQGSPTLRSQTQMRSVVTSGLMTSKESAFGI